MRRIATTDLTRCRQTRDACARTMEGRPFRWPGGESSVVIPTFARPLNMAGLSKVWALMCLMSLMSRGRLGNAVSNLQNRDSPGQPRRVPLRAS
jgi:hypothetical protein